MTIEQQIASLVDSGQPREAIRYAREQSVIALAAAAGVYLERLDEIDRAVDLMRAAVLIDPKNPKVYSNLSYLLCRQGNLKEAVEISSKGVSLPDATADLYYNHGIILKNLGMLPQATEALRNASCLNPQCAMTHCQLGNVLLALGQFEEGLKEDEWRFIAHKGLGDCRRRYKKPDWDGEASLQGKKIVVFNEQGFGDAIQYSRYLKNLKMLDAYVILEIQKPLVRLYEKNRWVDEVIESRDYHEEPQLPDYDYVVSIGSLPHLLDPDLKNTPMEAPYLEPTGDGFCLNSDKMKVCIIWAGSQWHSNDRERSCYLKHFAPLMMEGVELYSVNQGDMKRTWATGLSTLRTGDDNIEVVDLLEGSEVFYTDLSEHVKDFNDTAHLLKQMNLLISVDTSVAHLAGAMGVPVWLLLPYAHEWRWLKNWYTSMTIFRQRKKGDWGGLLKEVSQFLQERRCLP